MEIADLPDEIVINGSRVRFTNHGRDRAAERLVSLRELREAAESGVRAWDAAVTLAKGCHGRAIRLCLGSLYVVLAWEINAVVVVSVIRKSTGRERRGQRKRWNRTH